MEHPNQDNPVPPDLLKLRTRIDAIDHQILDLLVKRNEVIKEVASVKQQTGFGIRDFTRERELLENRGEIAETGGLRREVIESLFRVILWASRDKQASLNAALPTIVDVKTVGIIGGLGGIGSLLKTMFEEVGHTVLVADIGTELSNVEVASKSDVVVIAVPIEVTIDVIDEIGKHCKEDSLLIDVTSTKTEPVTAMCNQTTCSVVGTHPLFGPNVHSLQGQRIALVPERVTDEWLTWLEQLLSARGLSIILTTSKEHDDAMGIVQVLTHQATEILGRTIQRLNVDIPKTLEFTSPIYLIDMLMAARHFAQSSDLYASIQMSNPETSRVLDALRSSGEELRTIVESNDRIAFNTMFEEVHQYFGTFSEQALEQSSFLIDRLVERG